MNEADIAKILSNQLVYTTIISIFASIITGFISAAITFNFGIKKFHREIQYKNKLDRYLVIVDKCKGWVEGSDKKMSSDDRTKFVDSYRTIWLYGNSSVIKHLSRFLKIATNPPESKEKLIEAKNDAKLILKQAVIAMRKDLNASGKLKENDFDIFI